MDRIKHSLTYSGGQSRGCVRTFAPQRRFGFVGYSPYTRPSVVSTATAIPFDELSHGSHDALYSLKGEIVGRGIQTVLGMELPLFPKRRFQEGATTASVFRDRFELGSESYRQRFLELHEQ